jgi:hypothetical protein
MLYTERLSDHWEVRELCRPGDWPILANNIEAQRSLAALAVDVLEPVRTLWGAPIRCVSGYRSPQHNARMGGAPQSLHMRGQAADIVPADLDWVAMRAGNGTHADATRLTQFIALIEHHLGKELAAVGGIGKYPGFVHVDSRSRGAADHIARWVGKGIGSKK